MRPEQDGKRLNTKPESNVPFRTKRAQVYCALM